MDMKRQLAMKKVRSGGGAVPGPFPEGPPEGFTELPGGDVYVDKNGNKILTEYSYGDWEYNYLPIGDEYRNVDYVRGPKFDQVAAVSPYGAQPMSMDDYFAAQNRMEQLPAPRLRNVVRYNPGAMRGSGNAPIRRSGMRYL